MYELPLFPLHTVLFPGTPLHLHIFEPRYRMMIRRCVDENRPFGVALIRSGVEAGGSLAIPFDVGTTARIASIEPLSDGQMNLTALGEERFRILRLSHDLPYLVGTVEGLQLERPQTLETCRGAHVLRPLVQRYLERIGRLDKELSESLDELQLPEDPLLLMHLSAALLQIPAIEKQSLLEASSSSTLLQMLLRLYRREDALFGGLVESSDADALSSTWLN